MAQLGLVSTHTPMLSLNQKLFGEEAPSKSKRRQRPYRATVAPAWARDQELGEDDDDVVGEDDGAMMVDTSGHRSGNKGMHFAPKVEADDDEDADDEAEYTDADGPTQEDDLGNGVRKVYEPEIIAEKLESMDLSSSSGDGRRRPPRAPIDPAALEVPKVEKAEESDDESTRGSRRARIRARLLKKQKEEEERRKATGGAPATSTAASTDPSTSSAPPAVLSRRRRQRKSRRSRHRSDDAGSDADSEESSDEEEDASSDEDRAMDHASDSDAAGSGSGSGSGSDSGSGSGSGEDSSSEDESEDDGYAAGARFNLVKPEFVPKKKRMTLQESENAARIEAEAEAARKRRKQERRDETVQMVIDSVREAEAKANKGDASDEEMPNDDDDEDEDQQFQEWKKRELLRVKRDADERTRYEEEQLEIERRRNMTDEERKRDDMRHKGKEQFKEKTRMKFLQKYYHKGAFYQDDLPEELKNRDLTEATGQDRFTDRLTLPKVLQVKNFGLASRTKYTHLVDQDTTSIDTRQGAIRMYKPQTDQQAAWGALPPQGVGAPNPAGGMPDGLEANPWNDTRSSASSRFVRGGEGGFARPSKRQRR